jgi:uncharacterized protein Yka (UPF0111/DUF47 family)
MIRTRQCSRAVFGLLLLAILGITSPGTVCFAADRELSEKEVKRIESIESGFAKQIEGVEKSFAEYIEKLERQFATEVEAIEKELASVVEKLEKNPDDKTPLAKLPAITKKIQELAKKVDKMKKTGRTRGQQSK